MRFIYTFRSLILLGFIGRAFSFTKCEIGTYPDSIHLSSGNDTCTQDPCIVHPGKEIIMRMNFTSPRFLDVMETHVYVHTVIELDYPSIKPKDPCKGSIKNTACPLVKNEQVEFELRLMMIPAPEIQVGLTLAIMDERSKPEPAVCFNVQAKVKN